MCGIIACIAENAVQKVLSGLKTLEYRGYDSWGIAVKNNHVFSFHKEVGKIGVAKVEDMHLPVSTIALGHTRWATHGGVTNENSHPHFSNNNKIVVVHNGIIENYQELKEELESLGFKFNSMTDTEVIPNLIELAMSKGVNFRDAVISTLKRLDGSFGLVIMHADEDAIAFARRGSPLVLGINKKKNEFYVASDVPAFLEHTKDVIYLNDDELGFIDKKIEMFSLKGDKITRASEHISWSVDQAKKGDYPHFMIKEITEQEHSIKHAVMQPKDLIEKIASQIRSAKKVYFIGCGTSFHACFNASYYFSRIANIQVYAALSSEFQLYAPSLDRDTVVVALSQSGETADTLDAMKLAKARGAKLIAVVNVLGSSIERLSDERIMMNAGPEICVLSTKSYTAQVAIMLHLAFALNKEEKKGRMLIEESAKNIRSLIYDNSKTMKVLAEKLKSATDMYMIGRDVMYPTAMESALKIKEVSYIHAEGFAGAELKHGTIALIDKGTPAFAFADESSRALIVSNATEIKARGGFIIGLDSKPNKLYDVFIKIPSDDFNTPLYAIIPMQLLAYYLALARGCDPDKPRNLAKSVTVR